jgi:hypothetical protein
MSDSFEVERVAKTRLILAANMLGIIFAALLNHASNSRR